MKLLHHVIVAAALAASTAFAAEPAVLTAPRLAQFDSLDPQRESDVYSDGMLRLLYSTLTTYAYLERPYKIEPDLLESLPTLGADKLTYTFKLRKGIRFVDNACFPGGKGRELTADDVIYTFKRFADANVNVKSWPFMQGMVAGLDDFRAATVKAGPGVDYGKMNVAGLHKVDGSTFTVKLTHENPLFLHTISMPGMSIVPVEAVQMYKDRLSTNAVGTGPFMASGALERKGTLRLVRNPAYHRTYPTVGEPGDAAKGLLKDAGKKLPLVDVLEMPLIEESQPAALKFLRGELDRRNLDRANFTKMATRAADGSLTLLPEYAARFNLAVAPAANILFVSFNMRDPLVGGAKGKALRQAIAAAIDPQALINVIWNGRGIPLNSMVPVDFAGSERDTAAPVHKRDLALARKLMADAGYPDGKGLPPLTLRLPAADADTRNEVDLLKSQLAAVGVHLAGDFDDMPTFTRSMEAGNFQVAYYAWYADYPDAQDYYQLAYGKNLAPGPNNGNFIDAGYDKAYEASLSLPNGPQRYELFKQMNAILRDQVPLIPIYESVRSDSLQKWAGNFKRNVFTTEFQFMSIDPVAKKKGL